MYNNQVRNSLRYIASKDKKEFARDLKLIYQAVNKDIEFDNILKLENKWGKKYLLVLQSWNNKRDNLSVYFNTQKKLERLFMQLILYNQFIYNLEK